MGEDRAISSRLAAAEGTSVNSGDPSSPVLVSVRSWRASIRRVIPRQFNLLPSSEFNRIVDNTLVGWFLGAALRGLFSRFLDSITVRVPRCGVVRSKQIANSDSLVQVSCQFSEFSSESNAWSIDKIDKTGGTSSLLFRGLDRATSIIVSSSREERGNARGKTHWEKRQWRYRSVTNTLISLKGFPPRLPKIAVTKRYMRAAATSPLTSIERGEALTRRTHFQIVIVASCTWSLHACFAIALLGHIGETRGF